MDYITVIIQAVVQGLTEFLPVSSSGHLSVISHLTGVEGDSAVTLSIALHLGTLAAVFAAFRTTIWKMIKEFFLTFSDIFRRKFTWRRMNSERRMMFMVIIATALLIPCYPVKDFFTARQGDGDIVFEGAAFLFTAMLLFFADRCSGYKVGSEMKVKDALCIGLFQCAALFPGVSRSGSTTSAGLFCGLSKDTAVTFAFILGIPAILGGSVLELGEAAKSGLETDWIMLGVGFLISAVVGFFAIRLVKWLAKKNRFKIFGIYTLTLGLLCVGAGLWEHLNGTTLRELFVN